MTTGHEAAQRIVRDVAPLAHDLRYKRMVELGRRSITESHLRAGLQVLAQSPVHYERLLALMSVSGSRDDALIVGLMVDPSRTLALLAVKVAAYIAPDEVLISLLPKLARRCRKCLVQRLWRAGRAQINDAAYPATPLAAQDVLPWTTEAFIRDHLDTELIAKLDAPQWGALSKRVPKLIRDILGRELERSGESAHTLLVAVTTALSGMRRYDPPTGLSLLMIAARRMSIGALSSIEAYASLFPKEVAGIVRDARNRPRISLPVGALRHLDTAMTCDLMTVGALPSLDQVFARLRADQRSALYHSGGESWRDKNGALPLCIVQALPVAARCAEARHAFSLPWWEAEPLARLPYLSCLPFEEALALVRPVLSQPDGELRARAVAAVVGSGRYGKAQILGAILDFCIAREHEQDPVRLAMFAALAALPPSRWRADHLPGFSTLIDAALRARDCSPQTMTAAIRWLMGIIVSHTGFVAERLPGLVERLGHMGNLGWGYWESRMTDRQMIDIAPYLMGVLQTWIERGHGDFAISLILGFGIRGKAVEQFADILTVLTSGRGGAIARRALEALARIGHRKRIAELIPRLLERDPSWITVDDVSCYAHQSRQDLLTLFLTARTYKGLFPSGKAVYLPIFEGGFLRWTAAQQRTYAASLLAVIKSPKRSAWELYRAVRIYAAMPSVEVAPLIDLTRQDAADWALRDKALEALGRTDAGRGVAALVEAMADDRARVAIYALRRSLFDLPASRALDLLGQMPRSKVTIAKEIVRLAGDLRSDAAYAFLAGLEADGHLHRDVRIALLRAYWNFLDRPQVWQRLHDAACSRDPALARASIRIPRMGLSLAGQQSLTQHLALLLAHPDAQVRKETLERLIAQPPGQGGPSLLAALTAQLDSVKPALVELAATALLITYAKDSPQEVATAVASIARAESLEAIVTAYRTCQWSGATGLDVSAGAVVDALLVRRWHPGQALRLAFSVLMPSTCLSVAIRFAAAGLLHPGAVNDAISAIGDVIAHGSLEEVSALEGSLGAERSPAVRRIGLELLCDLATKKGWTAAARRRLAVYRHDGAGWVSDTADLVRCPDAPDAPPSAHA